MTENGVTVILANGQFPRRGGAAEQVLFSARRVVACDGAANAFHRRYHRWPDFIIGDMDSFVVGPPRPSGPTVVHIPDQDTNDLTKAIQFCRKKKWHRVIILGATGKREDHSLGNVFRGLDAQIPILTDNGIFRPIGKRITMSVEPGTAVSVFAPDPSTKMTSTGLEWPLDGVHFDTLYRATLNRAIARRITISSNRKAYVYVHEQH